MGHRTVFTSTIVVICIALVLTLCEANASFDVEIQSSDTTQAHTYSEMMGRYPMESASPDIIIGSNPWVNDFVIRPSLTGGQTGSWFVKKSTYNQGSYSLLLEMGNIGDLPMPAVFSEPSFRGARFSFMKRGPDITLKLSAFTTTNNIGESASHRGGSKLRETFLVGASSEIGFLAEKVKIYFATANTISSSGVPIRPATTTQDASRAAKFSTLLDPFWGRVVMEAAVQFSVHDWPGRYDSLYGTGHELKLKGRVGKLGYEAAYRHPVSEYSGNPGSIIKKDRSRYSISSMYELPSHSFNMKLGLDELSVFGASSRRMTDSYEGILAYAYKGLSALPLGLEYRSQLLSSKKSAYTCSVKKSLEEAISGNIRFLNGNFDLGLDGRLKRRNDADSSRKEFVESFLSLSPALRFSELTLMHSLSLRHSSFPVSGHHTDLYSFSIGTKGAARCVNIGYEVNSEFNKSLSRPSGDTWKCVKNNLRLTVPLSRFLTRGSSVMVLKSQYDVHVRPAVRKNDFSFLLTIDSG